MKKIVIENKRSVKQNKTKEIIKKGLKGLKKPMLGYISKWNKNNQGKIEPILYKRVKSWS